MTYLTVNEAATVLRVHPATIRRMLQRGELAGLQVGSRWRVDESSLTPTRVEVTVGAPRRRAGVVRGRYARRLRDAS